MLSLNCWKQIEIEAFPTLRVGNVAKKRAKSHVEMT